MTQLEGGALRITSEVLLPNWRIQKLRMGGCGRSDVVVQVLFTDELKPTHFLSFR